jgi:hypothetical protein
MSVEKKLAEKLRVLSSLVNTSDSSKGPSCVESLRKKGIPSIVEKPQGRLAFWKLRRQQGNKFLILILAKQEQRKTKKRDN